jgi:hypothetical protein
MARKYHYNSGKSVASAIIILSLYIIFAIISYLYVILTGTYNGDYLFTEPKLSDCELFLNLLYTIAPFVVLFFIYKHYKKTNNKENVKVPEETLLVFIIFIIIFEIYVTVSFGVGKMGFEKYQAPGWIKILIQIAIRFDYKFGVFLYLIISNNKNKFIIFLLFLLILFVSLLKASLGAFMQIGVFIILQYGSALLHFIKKYFIIVLLLLFIFPLIVQKLYMVRSILREVKNVTEIVEPSTIIFGQLIGRLSSYSNSAMIMERARIMTTITRGFSIFQYPKESLVAFYGGFLTQKRYSTYIRILLDSQGNFTRSQFMIGTQGVLLLGLYQSLLVFFINIITLFIIINMTFKLASLLKYNNLNEFIFFCLCQSIMTGSAGNNMRDFVNLLVYISLFLVINFLQLNVKFHLAFMFNLRPIPKYNINSVQG